MATVAKFEIDHVQYLDENAEIKKELPAFAKDQKVLKHLYENMILTRKADSKAVALQRTGQMGTYASSLGQEAYSTGVGYALHKQDIFCPYYRDQGALIQRGVPIENFYAFWGGDERGTDFKENSEDFPFAIPIATQMLHAAGVAYAIKYKKEKRAVLTTCGEGGSSECDFYEAINIAGVKQLPLVFVVNNNQWAISVPLSLQMASQTVAQKAIAGGFNGSQVDGNDVIAVVDMISKALKKARDGGGPSLIEAITFRLCDHTTADDATRYIDKKELERAWEKEPLKRFEKYLLREKVLTEDDIKDIEQNCIKKVALATEQYLKIQPQKPESMFDYLYETLPEALIEQRNELLQEIK